MAPHLRGNPRRGEQVADPQAGQAVELGERPYDREVLRPVQETLQGSLLAKIDKNLVNQKEGAPGFTAVFGNPADCLAVQERTRRGLPGG